jgi:Holliday junction resolvase RusA-like endonuclease
VPPSWNASYRAGKGRFYTPDSITTFRKQVMVAGKNARVKKFPREQPVAVTMAWYRKRQAGDLDKRCSVVLDALIGVWYCDDAQVSELHLFRYEDKANPRLEVEVTALDAKAAA